jgi:hypothetical protein
MSQFEIWSRFTGWRLTLLIQVNQVGKPPAGNLIPKFKLRH